VHDLFHRSAQLVDKILKGANPANLPVEQPTKFESIITKPPRRSASRCRTRSSCAQTSWSNSLHEAGWFVSWTSSFLDSQEVSCIGNLFSKKQPSSSFYFTSSAVLDHDEILGDSHDSSVSLRNLSEMPQSHVQRGAFDGSALSLRSSVGMILDAFGLGHRFHRTDRDRSKHQAKVKNRRYHAMERVTDSFGDHSPLFIKGWGNRRLISW